MKITKISKKSISPSYAHDGDVGIDLYTTNSCNLDPGERVLLGTGIIMEIPSGYAGLIWDKSGLSNNSGLKVLGGVVDSGYRGEIKVGLTNLSKESYSIKIGDKIAQMLIQKVEKVNIIETEEVTETSRGKRGFGSTGK